METKELLKAGRLAEARLQIVDEVKASPAETGKRTLLFQIHALYGEWDKADRDLDLIAAGNVKAVAGVQIYKNIVAAEKERLNVFRNAAPPSFLPEPPAYLAAYNAFLEKALEKQFEEADRQYRELEAHLRAPAGTVDGKRFSGFRDTDIRTAFFLEAFVHERYVRIPFTAIRELTVTRPASLFDTIWATSSVTTWEGLSLNCFLPVVYAESYLHQDDQVKMGRMTNWTGLGGGYDTGAGQHVFQIGDRETALLEMQQVLFTLSDEAQK
jgi:type VI secretion system protein ImpE